MSFVETSQNHVHLQQLDGDEPQTTQPTSTVEPDDDTKKQRRVITEKDQSRDCCVCGDSTDCGDCDDCGNCGDCRDYGNCGDCCDHGVCRDCGDLGDIGDWGDCNLDCCDGDGGDDCTIL